MHAHTTPRPSGCPRFGANLLNGQEKQIYADAGYFGADKGEQLKDRDVTWRVDTNSRPWTRGR